jgi:hypothetical protein
MQGAGFRIAHTAKPSEFPAFAPDAGQRCLCPCPCGRALASPFSGATRCCPDSRAGGIYGRTKFLDAQNRNEYCRAGSGFIQVIPELYFGISGATIRMLQLLREVLYV